MSHWAFDSVFYHLYPLGCSGSPAINDFNAAPSSRLKNMLPWISHMKELGSNALYIGPLFESSTHGYDTKDYFMIDRRLGTNADLVNFMQACHQHGIRVIFDAVFNHVGRDHFAFLDVQKNGVNSPYRDWFFTDFNRQSCYGDTFWYEGWNEHYNLVKLNFKNDAVKKHLFDALSFWIEEFKVDGIRLDAADSMDKDFFYDLRLFCASLQEDFWLLGEVIHGDYREWANSDKLDSVTNYECYKGLWSSHNDNNYFEIAYTINRQFGPNGIYKNLPLYNFADNHDVNRVASTLKNTKHLFPLYILLFSLPGVPSIYYGSEWGITGTKTSDSDAALRPAVDPSLIHQSVIDNDLFNVIQKLITLRKEMTALRQGTYHQIHLASQQYSFLRKGNGENIVVAVNADSNNVTVDLTVPFSNGTVFTDTLNSGDTFNVTNNKLTIPLNACWGRLLVTQSNPL